MLFISKNFHLYTSYKKKKMINKFFKIINNKYSRIIKFVFFLRYLFGVFLSITLFLIIPKFFDYKKKQTLSKIIFFQIIT